MWGDYLELSRWTVNAMICIPIKQRQKWDLAQTEEEAMQQWKQRLEWFSDKPGIARSQRELGEAKIRLPLEPPEGVEPFWKLGIG